MTDGHEANDAAFLARASEMLAESLDYETTLKRVASLAVPRYADWCMVDLIEGDRTFHRVAVANADPAQDPLAASLRRVYRIPDGADAGLQAVLLGLEPYAVGAIDDLMLHRIASDGDHLAAIRALRARSFLAVPLIARGTTIGALSFISTTRAYNRDDLGVARELSRRSAHAVDNARLFRHAQRARLGAQFLADAGRLLAESLDAEVTLPVVADLIVDQLADWCTVAVLEEDGSLRRVAAAHREPAKSPLVEEYLAAFPPSDHRGGGFAGVLADGRSVLVEHITDASLVAAAQNADHLRLLRALGCTSCILVPITVRGRVVGVLSLMMSGTRHFERDDAVLAEAVASRMGLALENARLHRRERQTAQMLDAIVRSSPLAIDLLDTEGTVHLWNPAAEQIFGWTRDEVIGRVLPAAQSETAAEAREHLARVAGGETISGLEVTRQRRDGAWVEAQLWSVPITLEDGSVRCMTIIADITERKKIEAERGRVFLAMQRARIEAETANRAKDEFLAMLGHELRNPLAPIVSALQVMQLRGDESSRRERGVIDRQVKHLVRLVDDLMDVSRITRGMIQLEQERVEIGDVVGKAIEMAHPLVEQRNHRLTATVPEIGLPVHGDPARLAQIVANLLTNAAKYTDPGGQITVTVTREGDQVEIRVADTGIGISPELLPRIFDSFAQEAQGIDRSQGGLGIGLTIVRSLVVLHGGTVEARSAGRGSGAEFLVRLPMAGGAGPTAAVIHAPIVQRGPAGSTRVLVADDNEDAAGLMADALRMLGHDVRVSFSGTDAVAEQARFRSTVALVDIGLPGLDGYEVARRLRADPAHKELLLVAITGYGQQSDRARALAAGFDDHLVKPVDIAAIQSLIAARGGVGAR